MLYSPRSYRGVVVAPHHLAAEAGLSILRDGGNAVEAMVAAAATVAVAYPHMNSLGGDGFWLIRKPGQAPVAIDACGRTGSAVTPEFYVDHGFNDSIPSRGAFAANTVAGTVSGWDEALRVVAGDGAPLPIARLLEEAIYYAENGIAVTESQANLTAAKLPELETVPGFTNAFLANNQVPEVGARFLQPRIGQTLRRLSTEGLDSFYRGELSEQIAADLARAGAPITLADLREHRAQRVEPLSTRLSTGTVYNLPPPTQGFASLLILALFDRLAAKGRARVETADGAEHVHALVEATKQAFIVRDQELADPDFMRHAATSFLTPAFVEQLVGRVDMHRALPWPHVAAPGDTVWLGAIDAQGCAVSFIQSIYWEFGSGVVLEDSGLHWQNRGISFPLHGEHPNVLAPKKRPFHTLNPALAELNDGRILSYGTMGGEGQPQTQAAIYSRYAHFNGRLSDAVTSPRWLLGRTWGSESTTLKLESRFDSAVVEALAAAGHDVEIVGAFDEVMGHAGALVRHPDGLLEGAADPRSDGQVAAY